MSNFVRRFINSLVSVPVMLLISGTLLAGIVYFGPILDHFEKAFQPVGPDEVAVMIAGMLVGALLWCVMALGAVAAGLYAVVSFFWGVGLLWRRIEKDDFLQNSDGSVFKKFDKTEFVWRWDSVFHGRQLMSCDIF